MQRVFIAQHHPEAHFVCGLLEADGIAAEVRGADPDQLRQAREIIRRYAKGEAPEATGSAWSCPACGEAHAPQFTACWQCGADRPESGPERH